MKRMYLPVIITMIISMFTVTPASAEASTDMVLDYDFNNYNTAIGSGIMPDANWKYKGAGYKMFGGVYDNEKQSYVLATSGTAEPMLCFNKAYTSGKLHISFDLKMEKADAKKVLVGFYDTRGGLVPTEANDSYYSKILNINRSANQLYYYTTGAKTGDDMIAWDSALSGVKYTPAEWHRFDIIMGDVSSNSTALANYYIDGQLINSFPIYFKGSGGFKSIFWRVENLINDSSRVYMDNVYVRHYVGDDSLYAEVASPDGVKLNNGKVTIKFAEPIDGGSITPSDIIVKRKFEGYTIPSESILIDAFTNDTLTFKINETLKTGKYTIRLSENVKGLYYNKPMSENLYFRTESEVIVSRTCDYLSENFDSFTETNGALPTGWDNLDRRDPTCVLSLLGMSGNSGDNAMGIVCTHKKLRYTKAFDIPVPAGKEFIVQFDAYYKDTGWLMYLLENRDMAKVEGVNSGTGVNTSDYYDANIAIGMNKASDTGSNVSPAPILGYATSRVRSGLISFRQGAESCKASPEGWHNYKIKVSPVDNSTVRYTVSVDGNINFTGLSQRAFMINDVMGIGFATVSGGEGIEQDFRIDNVEAYSQQEVTRPEIDDVYYLKYDGTEQNIYEKISTATPYIKIVFNSSIKQNGIENNVILNKGGSTVNCIYTFTDDRTLIIRPENMLDPSSSYVLTVTNDISAAGFPEVKALYPYVQNFKTLNDPMFEIFDSKLENNIFNVSIVKSNKTTENKFTLAVAAYKNDAADGVAYKELVGFTYLPIVIPSGERGVFTYSTEQLDVSPDSEVKAYLTEYPSIASLLEK